MSIPAPSRHVAVWAGDPAALGLAWGSIAVVAGEDAAAVAEMAHAVGAPPVAHAAPGFALLTREPPDADLDTATAIATALPAASVHTAVLRHAWTGAESLGAVVAEARRVLVAGGRLLLADWDLDRVLTAAPQSYPDAFFYAALPGVAAHLRVTMAYHLDLALALGRAGFTNLRSVEVDEVVAEFDERPAYLAWLRDRGFRGIRHAAPEQLEAVRAALPALVRRLAPLGQVTHREPWRVAVGVRPG